MIVVQYHSLHVGIAVTLLPSHLETQLAALKTHTGNKRAGLYFAIVLYVNIVDPVISGKLQR